MSTPTPGYYVSVIDPTTMRAVVVDGPFETHGEALGRVEPARAYVTEKYPFASLYAFGTCLIKAVGKGGEYTKTELL